MHNEEKSVLRRRLRVSGRRGRGPAVARRRRQQLAHQLLRGGQPARKASSPPASLQPHRARSGIDYRNTAFRDTACSDDLGAGKINVLQRRSTATTGRNQRTVTTTPASSSRRPVFILQDQIKLGRLSFQLGGRQDFVTTRPRQRPRQDLDVDRRLGLHRPRRRDVQFRQRHRAVFQLLGIVPAGARASTPPASCSSPRPASSTKSASSTSRSAWNALITLRGLRPDARSTSSPTRRRPTSREQTGAGPVARRRARGHCDAGRGRQHPRRLRLCRCRGHQGSGQCRQGADHRAAQPRLAVGRLHRCRAERSPAFSSAAASAMSDRPSATRPTPSRCRRPRSSMRWSPTPGTITASPSTSPTSPTHATWRPATASTSCFYAEGRKAIAKLTYRW